MDKFVLPDAQWTRMEPHRLSKPGDPGRSGKDNRMFVVAILSVVRMGSQLRDIPGSFGK